MAVYVFFRLGSVSSWERSQCLGPSSSTQYICLGPRLSSAIPPNVDMTDDMTEATDGCEAEHAGVEVMYSMALSGILYSAYLDTGILLRPWCHAGIWLIANSAVRAVAEICTRLDSAYRDRWVNRYD